MFTLGQKIVETSYDKLMSHTIKERVERVFLVIAIASYLAHLLLILLNARGIVATDQNFFKDPIAAIYTPFSFILIYEVYLLVFFLPKSISIYIGKQYEIITLIVIRRIFKDIAYVELTSDWFRDPNDLQFTFDVATALILFFLIYLFYQRIKKRAYTSIQKPNETSEKIRRFVLLKRALAVVLVPTLLIQAIITFSQWLAAAQSSYENGVLAFKKINSVFFEEFFTLLIIVDVLLLLISFFYSDKFHKIMRNSGFVISTILIKISFQADGLINNALIISAVLFGYSILIIHNMYEERPPGTPE